MLRVFSYAKNFMTRSTTVLAVRKNNDVIMIGDGQITVGSIKCKTNAVKIRKISEGQVICGFAGTAADCLAMVDLLEKEFEKYKNQTLRCCVNIAKLWRTDKYHRHLSCDIVVSDKDLTILMNGQGDVIQIEDGIVGIGSGGHYAAAAAKALWPLKEFTAEEIAKRSMEIASDMCIYTSKKYIIEKI